MPKRERFLLATLGWLIITVTFLTVHDLEFWHQQASQLAMGIHR